MRTLLVPSLCLLSCSHEKIVARPTSVFYNKNSHVSNINDIVGWIQRNDKVTLNRFVVDKRKVPRACQGLLRKMYTRRQGQKRYMIIGASFRKNCVKESPRRRLG